MIKILNISETKEQRKNPRNMDLLTLDVRYESGEVFRISMFRANVNALVKKNELIAKYNIPQKEIEDFIDLVRDGFDADHFYDNEE